MTARHSIYSSIYYMAIYLSIDLHSCKEMSWYIYFQSFMSKFYLKIAPVLMNLFLRPCSQSGWNKKMPNMELYWFWLLWGKLALSQPCPMHSVFSYVTRERTQVTGMVTYHEATSPHLQTVEEDCYEERSHPRGPWLQLLLRQ